MKFEVGHNPPNQVPTQENLAAQPPKYKWGQRKDIGKQKGNIIIRTTVDTVGSTKINRTFRSTNIYLSISHSPIPLYITMHIVAKRGVAQTE